MGYFILDYFDTLKENQYDLIMFLLQIFVTKKHLFCTKTQILMLPFSEAAVRRCSAKKMFLKILQKIRKTLVPTFLFYQSCRPPARDTPTQIFSSELCKIVKKPILQNTSKLHKKKILHKEMSPLDTIISIYLYLYPISIYLSIYSIYLSITIYIWFFQEKRKTNHY